MSLYMVAFSLVSGHMRTRGRSSSAISPALQFEALLPHTLAADRISGLQRALAALGTYSPSEPAHAGDGRLRAGLNKQIGIELLRLKDWAAADASFALALTIPDGLTQAATQRVEKMRQRASARAARAAGGAKPPPTLLLPPRSTEEPEPEPEEGAAHCFRRWSFLGCDAVSADSRVYRFGIDPNHRFLKTAFATVRGVWHVVVKPTPSLPLETTTDGLTRQYTPLSDAAEHSRGELRLLVKSYPHGQMSAHFERLASGCTCGPSPCCCGLMISTPHATVVRSSESMRVGGQAADEEEEEEHAQEAMWPSQVVLVAGGTGVLPLLQLARWLLLDAISPQERPRSVWLLSCNHTAADALCLPELMALTELAGGRLRVVHALSRDASWPLFDEDSGDLAKCAEWSKHAGRLSPEVIRRALSPLAEGGGVEAVVCGPLGLLGTAARLLREEGCPETAIHCMRG